MEREYKIFSMGFNKILDLIESADENIANNYKKLVNVLPQSVIRALPPCKDYQNDCESFSVDFMRFQNAISLDFSRKKNFLRFEIYVHRLYDDDLGPKKLFSINMRNTPRKQPNLQFNYVEINGKLELVRTSDKNYAKNLDFSCEVYLEYENFEPYLMCKYFFRGIEASSKRVDITFDELTQYLEEDEAYEEDLEIEFDADFDL